MSHVTKEEYLSAFVDGEAGSFEQHRLCDQLQTDQEMRDKLCSFSLIGEAMRNQSQSVALTADTSFLSGITDAIADDEPLSSSPEVTTKSKSIFNKPVIGYAVAASVAAVAAISFQNYLNTSGESAVTMTDATVNSDIKQPEAVMVSSVLPTARTSAPARASNDDFLIGTAYKAPDAKTRGLMNKYVAHHLQYASSSTLMPRVRAVSYSTDF